MVRHPANHGRHGSPPGDPEHFWLWVKRSDKLGARESHTVEDNAVVIDGNRNDDCVAQPVSSLQIAFQVWPAR